MRRALHPDAAGLALAVAVLAVLAPLVLVGSGAGVATAATPAATTFAGQPKVAASAFTQVARQGTVGVIVALAQGSTSLADQAGSAGSAGVSAAAVDTAQAVGAHLAASLPTGSAHGTRQLAELGMVTTTVDAQGLAALQSSPDVASVTVSQWRKPDLVPEETAVGAPAAWSYGTGYNGAGEAVAIIDTGVQPDHPFFGGRVIDGACFTGMGEPASGPVVPICPGADSWQAPTTVGAAGSPSDAVPCTSVPSECLHGTHVAGIAAGGTGSTSGNGSGVAWGANLVAVQVFTTLTTTAACGGPAPCIEAADSDVLAGLNWLMARRSADHIVAANMSFGSSTSPSGVCDSNPDDVYHSPFGAAIAAGIAPVVAAGNAYGPTLTATTYPTGLAFPACDSNAISVGAVTDADSWTGSGTDCSAIGQSAGCSFSQDAPQLSMVAPGWDVTSSVPGGTTPPGSFAALWGTSMATPFITGAFAVVEQEHPTWGVADVEALLRGTGMPIRDSRAGTWGGATPMLDLGAAVDPPTFHAIAPGRLLDTRNSAGLPNSAPRLGGGTVVDIDVTGSYGVPTTGVSAVVLNVTAVNPVGNGFVTVWPAGMPQPATSNLNLTPGVVKPNLVTVKVGASGEVSLYNQGGSVDLVIDIDGWYDAGGAAATGGTLHPVTPLRVLDTRAGTGLPGATPAQVAGGATLDLPVSTLAGLPSSATAVVLNLTSVNASVNGFVTAYPAGSAQPTASDLNPEAGQVSTNLVVVPLGPGGDIELFNAGGSVDLVADLAGWYDNTPTPTSGHLVPLSPARLLDTRSGVGASAIPVGPSGTLTLQVTGRGGVPNAGVSAVVLNLTAVHNTGDTFITAWPSGVARPTASNLNPIIGRITSNLVVVPVGAGGQIQLFNLNGSTDLVADVFGWYSS